MSSLCPGIKVLPTYHPAAVLRNWAYRPIAVVDFMKAKRESAFPEIIRPERQVLVSPTLAEIAEWLTRQAHAYAVDIETGAGQIKCIGFARSRSDAICIPFVDLLRLGGNYWVTQAEELIAWQYVQQLLARPVPKIFQNGIYDLQYILRMGLRPTMCYEDTMLLHHSLYPELQKGLGFLGSVYTGEASWKLMNRHKAEEAVKADE